MECVPTKPFLQPPPPLVLAFEPKSAWNKWEQQFSWWATAIHLDRQPAEVQVATFMTVIGPEAIDIYNSFNLTSEQKLDLAFIKSKFTSLFNPHVNIICERFKFNQVCQRGRPFDVFLGELLEKAKKCEFGEMMDELIRDRIVSGVHGNIRAEMLHDEHLTLNKAINIGRMGPQPSTNKPTKKGGGGKFRNNKFEDDMKHGMPQECHPGYDSKVMKNIRDEKIELHSIGKIDNEMNVYTAIESIKKEIEVVVVEE